MKLGVVILAAGQGTRMKSDLPKVLHPLADRPLVGHVITTARQLNADRIAVVYGHGGEQVPRAFSDTDLAWVEQAQQLGTGHAVEQAMPRMSEMDRVLVLYGDVPLTSVDTLQSLLDKASDTPLALLTVDLENPSGYGRIVRDTESSRILRIVEQKDASDAELSIQEINTGILVADRSKLSAWLSGLENANAQGEYYLTDIVEMAVNEGIRVSSTQPEDLYEVVGVNDRRQLSELERRYQHLAADRLMREGVTLRDPARFDLRGTLTVGKDVEIDINVLIEGDVYLGDRVRVGPNTVIRNSRIDSDVELFENCIVENSTVGAGGRIGPYARLRPGAELSTEVHVGNFVEIKKSTVDHGSKINHLSYIGDCSIGKSVNIGAGTITCNYDGANKFRTIIHDDVFIGSDTQLVAPVEVGRGATVGAGATITRDVPQDSLSVSRAKQTDIDGWKRPRKEKKA
ncbi:MAG: UDP-N-acetylglucosamine diphosphorylase/glucosamine-1-phosphate N-acetyltransferase [Gammaproteobacteria bacterium]|nr:UDP-N-acetylglucosamine diphosphorylase/glucosamine-1-phosphate N-acetyltransferase [Gammaproteobacteria bacterium]